MQQQWKTWAGALLVFVCTGMADASTYVKYVGTGAVETVWIPNLSGGGTQHVYAGQYNLKVAFNQTGTPTIAGLDFAAFCVDARQLANSNWSEYTVVDLEYSPVGQAMGTVKAKDIRQLLSLAGISTALNGFSNLGTVKAAAISTAIWEIINETAGTAYALGTDTWKTSFDATTGSSGLAAGWLNTLNTDGDLTPTYTGAVKVASSTAWQDYAILTEQAAENPVPEPLTMVSAFLAIGGLGTYLRKRTRAVVA